MITGNQLTGALIVCAVVIGAAGGYLLAEKNNAHSQMPVMEQPSAMAPPAENKILYWYDPMYPQQHFEQPGKSPFMDMQLVPKYVNENTAANYVRIDPQQLQNISVRYTTVTRGMYAAEIHAEGTLNFNERNVAKVQTRTSGFVERVYPLAPGDIVAAGVPIADLLVPEWAAAQIEFLALLKTGESSLIDAARERMKLLGMSSYLIKSVEQGNHTRPVITIHTPIAGAIQDLEVRNGMTVSTGDTLARINGLETVWLDVAVPVVRSAVVKTGDLVEAKFTAYPGEIFTGKVIALLPEIDTGSRTLVVRLELENSNIRLRPGMYADVTLRESAQQSVLRVASEAVIRTGRRALVMLAEEDGRFLPVEVETGPDVDGMTVILNGVEEGQQVVASGQFLFDSEANLRGIIPRAPEKMPVQGDQK